MGVWNLSHIPLKEMGLAINLDDELNLYMGVSDQK